LHDIIEKLLKAMAMKKIPFSFLVGDLPTYKTVVKLKAETPVQLQVAFHQQMSYIHAIYKRFKGSGIADILVAAGAIVKGSIDHALQCKHYRRGVRCIILFH
jgi:hypothetical protein